MRHQNSSSNASLVFSLGQEDIQNLVKALEKRYTEGSWGQAYQEEFRRLIGVWFRSGQTVRRVFRFEPTLSRSDVKLEALVVPVIGRTGRIVLGYLPGSDSDPKLTALSTFVHFLLNPENMRLGGPCPCCGMCFYKQILRGDQRYCSSECSRKETSLISHRKERKEAKRQKIEKVKGMIKKLKRSHIKGWKKAINGLDPEIKLHWLTRAVNRGEIEEPAEKA
jgi:hypothetical protein